MSPARFGVPITCGPPLVYMYVSADVPFALLATSLSDCWRGHVRPTMAPCEYDLGQVGARRGVGRMAGKTSQRWKQKTHRCAARQGSSGSRRRSPPLDALLEPRQTNSKRWQSRAMHGAGYVVYERDSKEICLEMPLHPSSTPPYALKFVVQLLRRAAPGGRGRGSTWRRQYGLCRGLRPCHDGLARSRSLSRSRSRSRSLSWSRRSFLKLRRSPFSMG